MKILCVATLISFAILSGIAHAAEHKMPEDAVARSLASSFGVTEASLEPDCSHLTDGRFCNYYVEPAHLEFRLTTDMTMSVSSSAINADENGPLPQGNSLRTERIKAFVTGAIFLIGAAKPTLSDAECGAFLKAAIERATRHGGIKEAEWIDSVSPGSPRFTLVRENETLRFEVKMAFEPIAFKPRLVPTSATLVAAVDGSFPDEIQAFAGKKALFVDIKTDGNVICAEDSPPLMVADVNGKYIALNGMTRSWSRQQGLRVFRGYKWHAVLDPDDAPDVNIGLDDVNRMINVALRLCPAPKTVEEGYRWVLQAEAARKNLGAKYFGLP